MTPHLARNVFRPDPKKYILVQYLSIMRLHPSLSLMLPIIPVKNGAHAMDWLSFFARLYPSRCQCYLRSWSPRSWTTMECRTSTACLRQQMSLLQLPQPIVLRTATGSGRKGGDFWFFTFLRWLSRGSLPCLWVSSGICRLYVPTVIWPGIEPSYCIPAVQLPPVLPSPYKFFNQKFTGHCFSHHIRCGNPRPVSQLLT